MHVTRISDARPYEARSHFDMVALRLQGKDVGGGSKFWTGLSHFLPGGGADSSASPLERIYVVVDGEVTITSGGSEFTLGPLDSIHFDGGEERAIVNHTNLPASMLVIMEYPDESAQ
jgi:quercetin dioxygenase-like cupin family protein